MGRVRRGVDLGDGCGSRAERLLLLYVLVLKVYERRRASWTMDGVSVIVGS